MSKKNAVYGSSVTRVLIVSLFIGLTAVITASAKPGGSFAFLDSVKEFLGLERAEVSVLKEQPGEARNAPLMTPSESLIPTANGTLDFGTTVDGTTATTANTGFGGVRVGTGGGGFTIRNPGQTIGTAAELRGIAPTGGSINSVGVTSTEYGTAAQVFTTAFEVHFSGGSSGTWYFFTGNGATFGSAQSSSFTGAEVFTGLRFAYGASNAITTNNRNGANFDATGLSGSPFAQNTAYSVYVVGNNSASTVNYGNGQTVAANKYDLWINGVLVGNDLGKALLGATTNINAFRFYGENSTGNVATIALDNVKWWNQAVAPPTIATTGGPLSFGSVAVGSTSAEQTYTVSGKDLNANLVVTAPIDFEVSTTSGSGFASSVSLTPSSNDVASTTIYVRYKPTALGANTGNNITNTSTGAVTQNIAVSGTGIAATVTTSTAVLSLNNPSTYGDSVTFTATVTPGVTTGDVRFIEGGTCAIPAITHSGPTAVSVLGTASFSTSALTAPSHTITACYDGAPGFTSSSGNVTQTVNKATPTVTFGAVPTPTYLGGNFTVSASTNNTDSPALTYSVVSGPCALVSVATFSSSGAGTCVVQASGASTTNFNTASEQQSVAIAKATPTVTFAAAPAATFPGTNFTVNASTTNTDSPALTYSKVSGPCDFVSPASFTPTGAGNCVVQADGAATANFIAASSQQTVAITQITYLLTVTNGGNGLVTSSPPGINCGIDCTESYNAGEVVTLTATPDSGYSFDGWTGDCSGVSTCIVTMSAARTVGATFTINQYSVSYDANGGTGVLSDPNSPYNAGSTVMVLSPGGIARTGYTFTGWNTLPNGTGTSFNPGNTFTIFGNITFYAQWTINQYTVSYDGNGNTGGTAPAAQTADFGSSITLAGAGSLVRTGHTFNGWNTAANGSGTAYAAGASFTISASNTTLYAQWTPIQYSVFYNGNGNTGGTAPATQTADFGSSVTVSDAGTLVKTGYSFGGWNTAADGSGTPYAGGASFTIPTSNTTLYAQWTVNQYAVTYNANGGTGSQTDPNSPYNFGATVTVLGTGSITRTGYTFANWNTASDGSGTSYNPAATFTIGAANVVLYAQWTINTYTITATAGSNGTITPSGAVSVDHGADQSFTITPNAGYHVDTLTVDGGSAAPATSYTFTNVTATHTIHATFALNTYTITATAGSNGSISPNGSVSVNHGANQTFTITPSAGYHVDVLTVDGGSVPAATSYTFTNVTATHTIDVTFAANTTPIITFDAAPTPTYLGGDFTVNATTTNTDSPALTYSVVSGPCALVSGATFASTGAGTCQVQASGAATTNYNAATATQNVTIAKANQATVTLSGVPGTATYGDTFTAVGGGGSGTGAFSYAVTGTACTVHSSTGAGSVVAVSGGCSVTATRAGDTDYNPATSAASVITTINPANQATLTVDDPGTVTYGSTPQLTTSGGSGTGAVTFSDGGSAGCTVTSGGVLTVVDAGAACNVTATKAADANYNATTSAPRTIILAKANQATLTVDDTGTVTYGSTPQLTTSGGSGTGAVTFSDGGSAGCTVTSGGVLTVVDAGAACNVTATRASDNNYNAATSAPRTIILAKANQAALTAVATPSSVTYGSTSALGSTGGSGTGSVTFSHGVSTGCSVTVTTLSVTNASGTCEVTATKAADNNYNAATSAALTVTLVKATPTVTFGAAPTPTYLGGNFTVSASTTNTDSAALTYSVVSGPCAPVSGATFSSTGAGTCQVQASGAATANFTTASATQNVTIAKATPSVIFGAAPTPGYPGADFTVSASTSNTDSSALTYSKVGGPCNFVSGATFSSTGAGTCIVRADGAASTNFNAAFDTQNVTIAAVQYTINASAGPNGTITPSGAVVVNSGASQAFTISADAGYHIADVLVDSVSQGTTGTYTFTNVTANHTISATFAINTYTIAASAGANGSITPSGSVTVNHGANQTFTITPDGGYNVANVLVDGVSVGAVTSHTFTNVTANHTISATFFSGAQALIVYVDDNWAGTTIGTDPDGGGPASSFGYDAFATIQDGVAGVAVNGTVIVNPGSYTGDINVNRAIDVRGVFTTTGAITVTAPGASISPGASPGIINSGNLSLTAGSTVNIEVNGPIVGTQYDQLNVTGTVALGNANLNVMVSNLYTPTAGQTFTIVNNDGNDPVTGTFAGLAENDVFYSGTTSFRISYAGGSNNNDVVLTTVALCNSVSIPNYTALSGNQVTASINVDNTTGNALQSTDFTVTYNPAVVTFSSASLGPVTAGSVLNMNSSTPGTLVVSIFKATPFSGAGSMLDITFNTVGQPGTSTPVAFNAFKFNEGTQCISTSNGSVSVVSGTITGTVTYGNSIPAATRHVPNTTINAAGSVNASGLTNLAGAYSISSLGAGSYTVTPSKSGEVNGAVSGMDSAQIAQWVVGLISLNATQQTVADVSGTGGVSSFDSALIARYVVSLPNAGSSGTWRFAPASTTYPHVNVNRTGDYTALLMGDVSGNWIDPLATRPAPGAEELEPVAIVAPELSALVNTGVTVPVEISDTTNKGILAYQFELRYDPSVIEPAANPADLTDTISGGYQVTVNAAERGLLRVVVFGTQALSGAGRLINLKFNAIGNPGSASDLIWENLSLNEGGFDIRSTNGRVTVTASPSNNASLRGRVMSAEGQPIRNARVTLTDTTGQSRIAITGSLGYYQFTGLQLGETYTVRTSAKRHRFQTITVSVSGEAVNLDIIAQPGG